jgi:hypothetical protein
MQHQGALHPQLLDAASSESELDARQLQSSFTYVDD